MKELWQKLKDWYTQLEQRERRAVAVGGVALLFAMFYFGFWSPLLGKVDAMRKRIAAQQETLAWMQGAEARINQLGGAASMNKGNLTPVALLTLLQDQVNDDGLHDALTQLKQAGTDSIHLQFKNVSFDRVVALLIAVIQQHQVSVTLFNATAQARPGLVDVNVMLKLG